MTVTIAQDSNLIIGQQVYPGTKWWTGLHGFAALRFHYDAATHISGPCNDAELIRSHLLPDGAYKVTIYTQQRWGCFVPWSSQINARKFSNPNSSISLISMGQEGIITGTQIGMMRGPQSDSVLFAVAEGGMNVIASNGDKSPLPAGLMADVSPRGIRVRQIPPPSYSITWLGEYAVLTSPNGVRLEIDSQPYVPSAKVYLPRQLTAINIVGEQRSWQLNPPWWVNRGQR